MTPIADLATWAAAYIRSPEMAAEAWDRAVAWVTPGGCCPKPFLPGESQARNIAAARALLAARDRNRGGGGRRGRAAGEGGKSFSIQLLTALRLGCIFLLVTTTKRTVAAGRWAPGATAAPQHPSRAAGRGEAQTGGTPRGDTTMTDTRYQIDADMLGPENDNVVYYWVGGREAGIWRAVFPFAAPNSGRRDPTLAELREDIERGGRVAVYGRTTVGAPKGPAKEETRQ